MCHPPWLDIGKASCWFPICQFSRLLAAILAAAAQDIKALAGKALAQVKINFKQLLELKRRCGGLHIMSPSCLYVHGLDIGTGHGNDSARDSTEMTVSCFPVESVNSHR